MACWLDALAKVGDVLAGFTAFAAFIWAAKWGVPNWRRQRREEKRREAAGQCYVAAVHALDACASWAFTVAKSPDAEENAKGKEPILVWAGRANRDGFDWAVKPIAALEAVVPVAETYLPAEAAETVEQAFHLHLRMVARFNKISTEPVDSPVALVEKIRAFGGFQDDAKKLRERAKAQLLPLARFEG